MIDLSIITVNYNGLAVTIDMLNSVQKHLEGCRYECIVLDNGSRENEAIPLQQAFPSFTILRSEVNLGFAGGNNRCLEQASGRYLFFLNNDTLLLDNTVMNLINYLDNHPEIGACCPKIKYLHPENTLQFAGISAMSRVTLRNKGLGFGVPDRGQFETPQPTHYLHGAAMMVSRTALEKVGPLPEVYFLYYEETDWSEAFKRHGFELWYVPLTTVIHKEGQSTGSGSPLKQYYLTRNRLLFAKRNRSKGDFTVFALYYLLISCTKDLCLYIMKRKPQHAKAILDGCRDFFAGRFGQRS